MTQLEALKKLLLPLVLVSEVVAANDDTQTINLDPIIINSELLNKTAQESAQSIEIYDEETLENQAGLNTTRDVLETTSNASIVEGTGTAATVRGIDGTGAAQNAVSLFAGGRPRLSYEIDNRPVSFNELSYSDFSLFDVETVEALLGAQSSLVGRNAMAGTVNIKTKDPVYEDETILRAAAGNLDTQQLSAVINRVIKDDSVAFRLSADVRERDSSVEYEAYEDVNDPGRYESLNIRGKLLIEPDSEDNKKLLIGLSHSDYSGPATETVTSPYEDKVSNAVNQPQHNPITNALSLDYSQELSSKLYLQLNTSITDTEFTRTATTDSTNTTIDTSEIVLEPRLYYDNDELSVVTGLYLYRAREEQYSELFSFGDLHYEDDTDTFSVYSEGSYNLSDKTTLSMGLRYEQESRQRYGGSYSYTTGVTEDDFDHDEDYSEVLPKIGINWQQSATVNWGAQISKGYNAGGAGWALDGLSVVNYEYDEETSWTYEIYSRQQFLEGKLSSSQNLFYSRYKDLQLAYSTTGDWDDDNSYSITNVDKVNTFGLEQTFTAILSDEFTLSGSLGLLNTDIVEFSDDTSLEGNDLAIAPSITSSVSLDWHKDNWATNLNLRYSGAYYTYPDNESASKTDAYVVVNARATYQMGDAEWFASIDNLLDEDAIIYQRSTSVVWLQPRTFLVGVEYAL